MKNIVIPDREKLDRIRAAIAEGGAANLHVLADFDRTLTRAFVNGEEVTSIMAILRDENYMTPDYPEKAKALFDEYHPIEVDTKVPLEQKKKAMGEWWRKHFDLLIASGMNKRDLAKILTSSKIQFREGTVEMLRYLHEQGIPIVILSSSGLGEEIISMYLEKEGCLYDNIHIVGNAFKWDEAGNVIGVKEPIIHVANKDETALSGRPFYPQIQKRRNVILLGDNIEDNGMVAGFDYESLLRVGFLNKNVDENLPDYQANFDVVVTNDGDMSFVNELVHECAEGREGHEGSGEVEQK
ncbi:MAG: hypothetical protein NT039_02010 [Candidatus Berkelbacteria bacterium]|nr:hypothetical protein [Candidatus Berkelbacteria bacterium]